MNNKLWSVFNWKKIIRVFLSITKSFRLHAWSQLPKTVKFSKLYQGLLFPFLLRHWSQHTKHINYIYIYCVCLWFASVHLHTAVHSMSPVTSSFGVLATVVVMLIVHQCYCSSICTPSLLNNLTIPSILTTPLYLFNKSRFFLDTTIINFICNYVFPMVI